MTVRSDFFEVRRDTLPPKLHRGWKNKVPVKFHLLPVAAKVSAQTGQNIVQRETKETQHFNLKTPLQMRILTLKWHTFCPQKKNTAKVY